MNKPIDDLFEQARASLKADMPLKQVEKLVQHSTGSTSFWTWKMIISSMSIIGIIIAITVGSLLMLPKHSPTAEQPTTVVNTISNNNTPTYSITSKTTKPSTANFLQDSSNPAHSIDLPFFYEEALQPIPVASLNTSTTVLLDSLGPKKSFTEYTLEIRKDNSEKELDALQKELKNYGIKLQIQQLVYNPDNTIKRFKGRFDTDSLFCSTQMSQHEFDIQGAFKSMQFTFRVANEKELKYLKIQSDDFEETIECYDDNVLSSTAQAQRIAEATEQAMQMAEHRLFQVQIEKEVAERQMQMAMREAERSRANILRLKADSIYVWTQKPHKKEFFIQQLNADSSKDIKVFFQDLEDQLESLEILTEEGLLEMDSILLKHTLENYSNELRFELENTRLDLQKELQEHLRFSETIEEEITKAVEEELDGYKIEVKINDQAYLETKADRLEAEAKRLRKEAKKLKKLAKKAKKK
ncbi:MAG: hypothetical protein AB8E82_15185 [Aureispira sp.]